MLIIRRENEGQTKFFLISHQYLSILRHINVTDLNIFLFIFIFIFGPCGFGNSPRNLPYSNFGSFETQCNSFLAINI